jgi:hypothetical protein
MHDAIERADIEILKKEVPRKQLAFVADGSRDHDHRADVNVTVTTSISEIFQRKSRIWHSCSFTNDAVAMTRIGRQRYGSPNLVLTGHS